MERLTVNSYRGEVERVIAVHHARLEMGLSRAREQEAFVRRVADVLTRHRVPFANAVCRLPFGTHAGRFCAGRRAARIYPSTL